MQQERTQGFARSQAVKFLDQLNQLAGDKFLMCDRITRADKGERRGVISQRARGMLTIERGGVTGGQLPVLCGQGLVPLCVSRSGLPVSAARTANGETNAVEERIEVTFRGLWLIQECQPDPAREEL